MVASYYDGYESVDTLMVTSKEAENNWDINCGCSYYHMYQKNEQYGTLKLGKGGIVRLSNNKAWNVRGIGLVLRLSNNKAWNVWGIGLVLLKILKFLHGSLIIAEWIKMRGLYILNSFIVISHASQSIKTFIMKSNYGVWDYVILTSSWTNYTQFVR